jgi:hypothetical protein
MKTYRGLPTLLARHWAVCVLLIGLVVGSCGKDIVDPPVERAAELSISPASTVLPSLGQQVQFTAVVRNEAGQQMPGVAVVWSSSNPAVLVLEGQSQFRSVSNGEATVTARVTGGTPTVGDQVVEASVTVTVSQEATSAVVTPGATSLWAVGQTSQWTVQFSDALGTPLAQAPATTWTSSDQAVATVSLTGLVTAMGDGTAQITAVGAGLNALSSVTVSATVPYTVCFTLSVVGGTAPETCTTLNITLHTP